MSVKTFYAIIDKDGELKKRPGRGRIKNSTGSLYTDRLEATRQAKNDGDSVVPLIFDNSLQPVFIRSKLMDPSKDPDETNGAG